MFAVVFRIPEPLRSRIHAFQDARGLAQSMGPHITAKFQAEVPDTTAWFTAMHDVLHATDAIDVSIGPIGWFRRDVVFLQVADPSGQLQATHTALVDATYAQIPGAAPGPQEDCGYVPHVSLWVAHHAPPAQIDPDELAADAAAQFPTPEAVTLTEAVIYQEQGRGWNEIEVVGLGPGPAETR